MFVNCKHCSSLVATDPATDLPPERCPRCAGVLRLPATDAPADGTAPQDAAAAAVTTTDSGTGATSADAGPAATGATPLESGSQSQPEQEPEPKAETGPEDSAPEPGPEPGPGIEPEPEPGPKPEPEIEPEPGPEPEIELEPEPGPELEPEPEPELEPEPEPEPEPEQTPAAASATTAGAPVRPAPGFLARRLPAAARDGAPRWALAAAIAALAVLLGLQILLADRDRLAAQAQWRPLVESACSVFGCSVPPWREPGAFVLLSREVRPHPERAGALQVVAQFRNDARWTQAWPRLLLTLSDVDGRPVAARAFVADEYLATPAEASGIGAGQTAGVALVVREPAAATVSYAFDFR